MGGSYIKMMKVKQSGNKSLYDKKFYNENKTEYQMRAKLNYYAKNTDINKDDLKEMLNGYGVDETLRLLKIKKVEDKLMSLQ
jgi:hypothetical protein